MIIKSIIWGLVSIIHLSHPTNTTFLSFSGVFIMKQSLGIQSGLIVNELVYLAQKDFKNLTKIL